MVSQRMKARKAIVKKACFCLAPALGLTACNTKSFLLEEVTPSTQHYYDMTLHKNKRPPQNAPLINRKHTAVSQLAPFFVNNLI